MRKLASRLFILVVLVVLCQDARSQDLRIIPDLRFENFNEQRNFVYGYIGNIAVDKKGYVWSTGNGLFRFDGLHVQAYTNFNNGAHGLRSNYNDDLVTDPYGRLWIGNGKGICFYNDTLDNFKYIDIDTAHLITYAYSFLLAGKSMWFVCNFGLCRLDLEHLTISLTSLKEFSDPIETFRLGDELLGISTRTGLYLYDIKKDSYIKKIFTWNGNLVRIRECISKDGQYWTATNHGLWQISGDGEKMELVKGTEELNISSLAFHPADNQDKYIWLGTINKGLCLFDFHDNKMGFIFSHDEDNPYSLQSNNVSSMDFDPLGRLWMGMEDGISLFDFRNQSWKTRKLSLKEGIPADNEIRKILPDRFHKDSVWMLCYNQGILLIDWKDKHIIRQFNSFPSGTQLSFSDMIQLDDGRWILLGKNELITWDPVQGIKRVTKDLPVEDSIPVVLELTSIIRISADDLYITSNAGLYLFHPSTGKVENVLPRKGVAIYSSYDLVQGVFDNKETIWMSSRRGLLNYNTRLRQENIFYNHFPDTITANYLNHVALTGYGIVLCAAGNGLGIFHQGTGSFSMITAFGTFNKPACFGVFVKDSIAWINSNAGLLQLNLITKKTYVTEVSQRTNVFSPYPFGRVGRELVIGYRNMYTYFDPALHDKPVLPSNTLIEKILLNNKPLYIIPNPGQEYRFNHLQNSFSFYFTSFEYDSPEQIHFRYKLEGHDNDWTYLDEQRSATYIRLPPGHYKFMVQSGNNLGQWNEASAIFPIYIVPPFWQRWWFLPLLALIFISLVIWVARQRIMTIRRREEEKTELNRSMAGLETRLLRSQMNPHFIFNSLNSIQKYIWENKEEDAAEYLASFARLMRSILENSRLENILLEEELAVIKLYVELEHRRSNGKFDYRVHADKNLELYRVLVPPLLIQPYIENAIWHGLNKKTSRGILEISIHAENDLLIFVIDDNGVGRSPVSIDPGIELPGKKSLGMEITRQRISKLQAEHAGTTVRIIDKTNNGQPTGTTVIVSIPFKFNPDA